MVVEKDFTLQVRITTSLKEAIDEAAQESKLTTSDWTRTVLARAVDKGAFGNWKVAAAKKGDRHGSKRSKPSK